MSQAPPYTDYADAHEHELQMLKEATESTAAGLPPGICIKTVIGNPLYPDQIPCEFVGLDIDGTSGDADLELEAGQRIAQLVFFEMHDRPVQDYSATGHYNGQVDVTLER